MTDQHTCDMKRILDAALGEWAERGYRLEEEADHILVIRYAADPEPVARFSQLGATIKELHETCRRHNHRIHECWYADAECDVPALVCDEIDCRVRK